MQISADSSAIMIASQKATENFIETACWRQLKTTSMYYYCPCISIDNFGMRCCLSLNRGIGPSKTNSTYNESNNGPFLPSIIKSALDQKLCLKRVQRLFRLLFSQNLMMWFDCFEHIIGSSRNISSISIHTQQ